MSFDERLAAACCCLALQCCAIGLCDACGTQNLSAGVAWISQSCCLLCGAPIKTCRFVIWIWTKCICVLHDAPVGCIGCYCWMLWGFALWTAWATASPYWSDKSVFICLFLVHVDGWSDKSAFFSSLSLCLSFSFNLRSILKADQTNLSLSFCFCVSFNLCSILKADQTNLSLSFCVSVPLNPWRVIKQIFIFLSVCLSRWTPSSYWRVIKQIFLSLSLPFGLSPHPQCEYCLYLNALYLITVAWLPVWYMVHMQGH